ncbi:MAG: RdgB/HAM1 family non-canonical purine NTP pyrophosphatase [Povalibacter sp.]
MKVVVATHNAGKLREFQELLSPFDFELLSLAQFTRTAPKETGLTFIENAILKARHAAKTTGLPAIADDSGIEVDALHGAPGIYSARFAGEGASDMDNLNKLLTELRKNSSSPRTARYQCALAFMRWDTDSSPIVVQASWEGRIIDTPRGTAGFGYDPIFELESGVTAAELAPHEKNQRSHRGKALRSLVDRLRTEFGAASAR